MAIYLDFNGKKIKGDVTAEGYKDCIEILSMNLGCGRHVSMEIGKQAGREATKPSLSEISVTKVMDKSSGELFKEALSGSAGVTVKIDVVKTGSAKLETFCTYELEDTLISSYNVSASDSGAPVETLTLSFSKVVMAYTPSDEKNKAGSAARVGYDLTQGKAV